MTIRAISFDFWNTLFTEPPGGFVLYQDWRRRRLLEALRTYNHVTDQLTDEAFSAEAALHARIWREEYRTLPTAERVGKILTHLEARLPEEALAELVNHYEEGILEHPPILIDG